MNSRERFARSKCDRCGRATGSAKMEWDLFTLPHDWPAPLSDLGDFCERCINAYTVIQWLAWFDQYYTVPEGWGSWASPAGRRSDATRAHYFMAQTQDFRIYAQ